MIRLISQMKDGESIVIRTDHTVKGHTHVQIPKLVNQSPEPVSSKRAEEYDPFAQQTLGEKDLEKVSAAIEYLNKTMSIFDRSLEFSIHEDTNRIIVRVINRSDHGEDVIREIPPERILDLIAALMNIVGLLVDQRA